MRAERTGWAVIWGASANQDSFWGEDDRARIGWTPWDSAEPWRACLAGRIGVAERFQGAWVRGTDPEDGVDVFARLMTLPHVLITAHHALFAADALSAIAALTIANPDAFARQGRGPCDVPAERLA